MKRILIWANTYYQLIMAIQMKNSLFMDDYVHLLLSNHSNNSKHIYVNIKELNVFNGISFVESKGAIQKRTIINRVKEVYELTFNETNSFSYYLDGIDNLVFDELISFNFEIDTYAIFSILSTINKTIKYSSYEEGILSYENIYYDSVKFKLIRALRKIDRKTNITDYYTKFYCTHPELYCGNLEAIRIPEIKIEDKYIRDILSKTFNLQDSVDYRKYKYIYFESIYETENRGIGELKILEKLVELVGKQNILVKKHPRSTIFEYERMGIDVDTNSSAPFEAIQINNGMSHCIFVAAASGSVLTVNSMISNPSEVRLFFPLTEYKKYPDIEKYMNHVNSVVSKLKAKGSLEHVKVALDMDDIIN